MFSPRVARVRLGVSSLSPEGSKLAFRDSGRLVIDQSFASGLNQELTQLSVSVDGVILWKNLIMAKRCKRIPEMNSGKIDGLVAQATDLHCDNVSLICDLKPQSEHYNAVVDLSDALARTIRNVSGEEPEWM